MFNEDHKNLLIHMVALSEEPQIQVCKCWMARIKKNLQTTKEAAAGARDFY